MAPRLILLVSSGPKKEEPRYTRVSEAKASHSQRMWAEVSSSAPHLLHNGLSDSPIRWRCLRRVLCPVRRPVTVLDFVLLKDRNLDLAPRQGPKINCQSCLWVSPRPRHHIQCWLTNHRLILLRVSCLESPKASSSPTNFRTEPSLVSSLPISLTRTPAYWNVYYTVPHNTHHTLYLDEIPSYHLRTRQLFICVLYIENEQLWTCTWNCSILYSFSITIL
jgi:hypothetical protein